ncbi:8-amino-7-oxononanoate synthase [Gracilimonas sp.]|uniref:8-amino-7-oxononanoate synthase n=1 Tax=Gracilimonas sp. TaxID=1974203 RepID=UPI0032EC8F15
MSKNSDKLDFISEALAQRKAEHRFRELVRVEPEPQGASIKKEGKSILNFCSNDYLGLATHPKVIKKSLEYARRYGAGSTASRLVSGNFTIHEELESRLALVFDVEAALVFNTGFQANATILSTLADRNSLILADNKVHNSLLQGAILSRSDLQRYDHNDYLHLEKLLEKAQKKSYNRIWIVSETVFSMDGDQSDVKRLIDLAEKYDALLFSDDAHALGVLGEKGLGLNYGKKGIHVSLGTFGKAFGAFGAFVACSQQLKDYLINFCPGFIYTTALPPAVIGALEASLELIPTMDAERKHIYELTQYFKKEIQQSGFETGDSNSQIIPVIVGDEKETISVSHQLENNGILATAIRPPTVSPGFSRIRITITAKHQKEDLDKLLRAFGKRK